MRNRTLWCIAFSLELMLMCVGLYLEHANATLGEILLPALTQLPGSFLSVQLLPETIPPYWLYVLTFILQTVFFSMVLHLAKAIFVKISHSRFVHGEKAGPRADRGASED